MLARKILEYSHQRNLNQVNSTIDWDFLVDKLVGKRYHFVFDTEENVGYIILG